MKTLHHIPLAALLVTTMAGLAGRQAPVLDYRNVEMPKCPMD